MKLENVPAPQLKFSRPKVPQLVAHANPNGASMLKEGI